MLSNMVNLTNQQPFYDPFNHGWVYLCSGDDGNFYIRSVLGKWAIIDPPVDPGTVNTDFTVYIQGSGAATLSAVDTDNKGATKDTIA